MTKVFITSTQDRNIRTSTWILDSSECREELFLAIQILRDYPTGQSDGTWIKRRQGFLEKFLPKEDIK